MSNIKITCDSTCDLPQEFYAKYDVEVISLAVTLGDTLHRDGVDITAPELFDYVNETGTLPKTSAISMGEYLDVFGKYVRNLHAKDGKYPVNGHDLGVETRIGDGKVDFEGVFKGLHAVGYEGPVTIEREISGDQQTEDINHARTYLARIIDDVYGSKS